MKLQVKKMESSWNLQVLNFWDSLENTSANTMHFVACEISETNNEPYLVY